MKHNCLGYWCNVQMHLPKHLGYWCNFGCTLARFYLTHKEGLMDVYNRQWHNMTPQHCLQSGARSPRFVHWKAHNSIYRFEDWIAVWSILHPVHVPHNVPSLIQAWSCRCNCPNMHYPSHSREFHSSIANLKEGLLLKPLHMQLHNTLRLYWLPWWCAVTFFFEQCLICSKWGTGLCWVRLQLKTFGWNQTSCFFICEISWCPGLIDFSATTQMLLVWQLWFVAISH